MSSREEKAEKIRRLMAEEGNAIFENTTGFNEGRYESVAGLEDYEQLKDRAREIKENSIERLPELIDQVTETVEANGGHVYLADDAADANEYIRDVVDGADAESVIKSKSMTSEEIEVNEALEADDVDVWETDLGEFVLQVADEAPSHIVAPAIHKSREDIAELFNAYFEPDERLETAEDLTWFAREYLADRIEGADVGMTGANFVTADTGTVALVTSEGNARKCVAATDTHVAVAGVEKLVPRFEDLQPFVELIARSGTGQDITSYVSLFSPPATAPTLNVDREERSASEHASGATASEADELGDGDDREFHLVLLDNGRTELREDDQLRETLYCIRCSACLNSCANFQHVGGHAFGGETYSGGIATGWEAGVHGMDSAAEFNDLCTGCTRCVNQCPVRIDIPWINTVVRDRINRAGDSDAFDHLVDGLVPDEEPGGLDLQKRLFGNFETLARLGSATAPLSNWTLDRRPVRWLLERVAGVDSRRDMPRFRRETLLAWFESRDRTGLEPAEVTEATDAHETTGATETAETAEAVEREVVLYPDLYTNYVVPERGKAAVRVLEALGVSVRVPDLPDSGRPPLSQGMIATAERRAERMADALDPHIEAGRDVVVIEPSDLAMFRHDYEKLLPDKEYQRLSNRSYEVLEYVYGLVENGADVDALAGSDGKARAVAYHSHCQQRTLDLEPYTTAILDRLGYDVVTSDVECCGMAGSFGYKSEYFELSMDLGESLAEQFTDESTRDRAVVASGTSCLEQLDALLNREVRHPVELLDPERQGA